MVLRYLHMLVLTQLWEIINLGSKRCSDFHTGLHLRCQLARTELVHWYLELKNLQLKTIPNSLAMKHQLLPCLYKQPLSTDAFQQINLPTCPSQRTGYNSSTEGGQRRLCRPQSRLGRRDCLIHTLWDFLAWKASPAKSYVSARASLPSWEKKVKSDF